MCEALGGYGEYITRPEDIRPALERGQAKVDEGMVALINVRTDYRARFAGAAFSDYST
jgi:thiamine pyrophosphate-dependent acetolactate synthase large subunit-like protein